MLLRVLSPMVVLASCAFAASCGPSLRMLHESTVYFERCHAAELSPDVSIEARHQCWSRWLRWYTTGQNQARVLYARERLVYLAQGEEIVQLPVHDAGVAPGEPVPVESAAMPEPAVDAVDAGADAASESSEAALRERLRPIPRTTGSTVCAPLCRPRWDTCADRCERDARGCFAACESSYRSCMQGCF